MPVTVLLGMLAGGYAAMAILMFAECRSAYGIYGRRTLLSTAIWALASLLWPVWLTYDVVRAIMEEGEA